VKYIALLVVGFFIMSFTPSIMAQESKDKSAPAATDSKDKKSSVPPGFAKLDKNSDGKLSLEEFKVAFPDGDPKERFIHADTNKDNFLSPDELNAAYGTKPDNSKGKGKEPTK